MKFAAEYFVPDVPLDVEEHVARQKYIVAALIDEVPDDDDQVGAVEVWALFVLFLTSVCVSKSVS